MIGVTLLVLVLLTNYVAHIAATSNIAAWQGLTGDIIQTKIVLEGGLMNGGTFTNGKWQNVEVVNHPRGVYYEIDLCNSFDADAQQLNTFMGSPLNVSDSTDYPIFSGGGMFVNSHAFFTYGGLPLSQRVSGVTNVIRGDIFQPNAAATAFAPGINTLRNDEVGLPSPWQDYIAFGAYASSPDESLGFYFGGMTSATQGLILYNANATTHVAEATPAFLKFDLTDLKTPKITAMKWPTELVPRAEGGLVWLPYGASGVLLAIGGVETPMDLFFDTNPPNTTTSGIVHTHRLGVYDIANDAWYVQETLEQNSPRPGQLGSFCTVVVPTQDQNSFSIYVYGGYDGTYANPVSDDVWVLSIPAFQWTQVKAAPINSLHGRQGHVCVSPNPTTMISIGGTTMYGSYLTDDSAVDVFDLNTLQWTGKYNATSNANYALPADVVQQLGYASAQGPGSLGAPTYLNGSSLANLFSSKYQGTLRTYYPYTCGTSKSGSGGSNGSSGKSPAWKIPVIAAVCAVVGVAAIAAIIFCCLRRRRKERRDGVQRTDTNRKQVLSWLKRTPAVDPAPKPSETSENTVVEHNNSHLDYFAPQAYKSVNAHVVEAPSSTPSPGGYMSGPTSPRFASIGSTSSTPVEAHSRPRHELMDNSKGEMSIRNHPMYPYSITGEQMSPRSDSISRPSDRLMPPRTVGSSSPSELAQNRSTEHLPAPLHHSNTLHENGSQYSSASPSVQGQVETSLLSPITAPSSESVDQRLPGSRGVVEDSSIPATAPLRLGHDRNQSSQSNALSALPSPTVSEGRRQSRIIEDLSEYRGSPTLSPQSSVGRGTAPSRSAYQDNLGNINEASQR